MGYNCLIKNDMLNCGRVYSSNMSYVLHYIFGREGEEMQACR